MTSGNWLAVHGSRRALLAAFGATPIAGPTAAASEGDGRDFVTVSTIGELRNATFAARVAYVLGYFRAGDQGGGVFLWQADSAAPDDRGIVIARANGQSGRWVRQYSGPIDIRWFGASANVKLDAAPAIVAALKFASAQAATPDIYIPAGVFLVSQTIVVPDRLTRIFGEGTLEGNIRLHPPIHSPIAPVNDIPSEITFGCLAGSCFYFPTLSYHLRIEGLTFRNFRFALAWFTAHNSPSIQRCAFRSCNVGAIFYQGCQTTHFADCEVSNTNVFVIAAATCFHETHPLRNKDNYYCDGLAISNTNANRRHYIPINDHFDLWFRDSILLPDVKSYPASEMSGVILQNDIKDIDKATGRFIYLPFRNPRLCFSLSLRDLDFGTCLRGVACINTDLVSALLQNIYSEGLFADADAEGSAMFILGHGHPQFSSNIMINVGIGIDRRTGVLIRWTKRAENCRRYWKIIGGYADELMDQATICNADII